MADLVQIDGWWWPASDERARYAILTEVGPAIDWLQRHNDRWSEIIQAGGNTGVYAKALKALFKRVITVEPDEHNHGAALFNLAGSTVSLYRAAFGDQGAPCGVIEHEPGNCGAHRIGAQNANSSVPMLTIDSLHLKPDVIWLDVEGYELQALKGAAETLKKYRPLVITEEKNLGRLYGYEDEAIGAFLCGFGYRQISTHGNDRMYRYE